MWWLELQIDAFSFEKEIIQSDFSKYKTGELRKFKSRGDYPIVSL